MITDLDLIVPKVCGAMLLDGTALYPHNSMQLNIYEPRYRTMLKDSLKGTWMFAIANLIQKEESSLENCTSSIGTLGIINYARELPDGKFAVVLNGIHAVRFERWNTDTDYPSAKISLVERIEVEEEQAQTIRSLLLDSLPNHMGHFKPELRESVIANLNEIPFLSALIDNIAHNFISTSDLRQELLSEIDDQTRASKLITALL